MILGLNHITITVKDLEKSLEFYIDVLGFKGHVKWDNGAYLTIGDLWFCLACGEAAVKDDYTHIAFDIEAEEFADFSTKVIASGAKLWKQNQSEGQSLYILDPDGHKLEIHAGGLQTRLEAISEKSYSGLVWL